MTMTALAPSATSVADDPQFGRVAATLIGLGAIGVVATSVLYAVAGPEAALPGGATSVDGARSATAAAAAWMRAAGRIGMPSDVLCAVGALMFAASKRGRSAGWAIAGWTAMAISALVFIVVDAMVSLVLPPAASITGGASSYAGLRALFDALFAIGAWTFAAGALAAAASARWPEFRWPMVLWSMRAAGALGVVASAAFLLGWPGSQLIGPGVALAAVSLTALAVAAFSSAPGESP
jgi:hypothetical protein